MKQWLKSMSVCGLLMVPTGLWAVADEEVAGSEEAVRWIRFIDAVQYAVAFEEMAPSVQAMLKLEDWILGLGKVRTPLGALEQRKIKTAFFTTELPNAPSGEYVVVQFRSQFAQRDKAVLETVTLMRGEHTAWVVSGYYLE